MKVLMLGAPGSEPTTAATGEFLAAGHVTVRCDTPDGRSPCRGVVAGGDCPLDEHVDVAVLVPGPGAGDLAHGAICAVRDRVPLVVFDPEDVGVPEPIAPWTSAAGTDLLGHCERAAHDGQAHVRAVVERLVALGVVRPAELQSPGATVGIAVRRDANRLTMTIELADSERHREGEIVRAARQALRDFDPGPSVIDVLVHPLAA